MSIKSRSCETDGCKATTVRARFCEKCSHRRRTNGEAVNADARQCKEPGCARFVYAKGQCGGHYKRRVRDYAATGAVRPKARNGTGYVDPKLGYRRVCRMGHPNATKSNGLIFEHTLVMSEMLGRPLMKGENVHHKNDIRTDNRPENLELWVRSQPSGQRPEDLVVWAKEILRRYGDMRSSTG